MTNYRELTKPEAAAALQEFLKERGPALTLLRERLVEDGQDPQALLDGSLESLVPLWRWLLSRLARRDAPGATDPASVPPEMWPSWERFTTAEERTLSLESLTLLDGLVSYLAEVVLGHAPNARWDVARGPQKRYHLNNHPVLVSGTGETHNFLPGLPVVDARASLNRVRESSDDRIEAYARALIGQLNQESVLTDETTEREPILEVEDIRGEPGGYDFEIGLSDELCHERSADVERLVRELSGAEGVNQVLHEDRDMILVRAPSWNTEMLEGWFLQRL
ncbi:hypothetical protein [Pseudarthrobacter sp. L1SW]|uniref:hypothetical protein n=1 Tax=Pseudarthrobacter sp. L1SW TaxID=2851598 RepID=UPI001E33654B|nr:hypothetical protein [Pseudarthrobacter sp. L1SW]UEL29913.1 hypothetical protein KTR40_07365 [Pseudarthrobacter sp. L1SW]